ncbi:hypothetical protein LCGC14_2770350 [marine sediment metagenome]|uniref:C2H2-type domain-containing protein n=1 Tax=marine sediment metagenome TaxID=412755 RepID=A0A0F8YWA8_9ZZZZ
MPDSPAVKAEKVRDLRGQLTGIAEEDEPEILFQMISPGREPVTVYSTTDGTPTAVPKYMIGAAMELKNNDGSFRFVADAKDAPEYKLGTIKCFLHKDSPERPILEMVGLQSATCPKQTLASVSAKRMHALHRHKQEWIAYQEHVEDQKEAKREARLDQQLDATLALARGGTAVATPKGECDVCGKTFKNLGAHKQFHKEV